MKNKDGVRRPATHRSPVITDPKNPAGRFPAAIPLAVKRVTRVSAYANTIDGAKQLWRDIPSLLEERLAQATLPGFGRFDMQTVVSRHQRGYNRHGPEA